MNLSPRNPPSRSSTLGPCHHPAPPALPDSSMRTCPHTSRPPQTVVVKQDAFPPDPEGTHLTGWGWGGPRASRRGTPPPQQAAGGTGPRGGDGGTPIQAVSPRPPSPMDSERAADTSPWTPNLDAEAGTGSQGHSQGNGEGDTARLSLHRQGRRPPPGPPLARGTPHLQADSHPLQAQPPAA